MGKHPKRLVPKSYINERIAEISISCVLEWQKPIGWNRNTCSLDEYEQKIIKEVIEKQAQARHDRMEERKARVERDFKKKEEPKKKPKKKHRVNNKYTKVHRLIALQLADNKCEKCGDSDNLHIHHMKYKSNGGTDDLANLMVLCELCHVKEHEGEPVHNLMLSNYRKRIATMKRDSNG